MSIAAGYGLLGPIDHKPPRGRLWIIVPDKSGGASMATSRISGLTFLPVDNPRFAVSHSERTELHEPKYFLPVEHRLENRMVFGFGQEEQIAALFEERKNGLSRQAKRAGTSPFWEGVAVLPAVDEFDSVDEYHRVISERLLTFKKEFESKTGCKVLHISTHLDEGELLPNGNVARNPHAHILIDRTISAEFDRKPRKAPARERAKDPNRQLLWKPNSQGLAAVQTMCAEALQMGRGSTVQERQGKPARKHVGHKEWRDMQRRSQELLNEQARDFDSEVEFRTWSAESKKKHAVERAVAAGDLKAAYGLVRGFLKGSGQAKQADYQRLKKLFEEKSQVIMSWAEFVDSQDKPDAQGLLWALRGDDLELLSEKRTATAEAFAGGPAGHLPETGYESLHTPLVHWQRDDADLYLLPQKNEAGKRLAFEDKGDRISIKLSSDFAVVEAALKLSAAKWPEGFEVNGSPEFKRFASEVASSLGLEDLIVNAVPKPREDGPDLSR